LQFALQLSLRSAIPTVQDRTSRPAISKHLRLLESAGLVIAQPQGTARICRLNARPLLVVDHFLRDYRTFWNEALRNLKSYVEEER
jgi:DNA-binding transcriptional ArsR family regulator